MNTANTPRQALQYWHKVVILLCLGWVVIWIYRPILTAIFPQLMGTIGQQTGLQLGAIASFYFFAYTAMQIPAGILVDKFGQRAVLIPGFITFIVANLIIANATNIEMVYVGSLLAGLGCGSYYASAYSLNAMYIPAEHRSFATAIINTGSALGMSISLWSSSFFVIKMGLPWQSLMYAIAVLLALMTVAFAVLVKKAKQNKSEAATANKQPATAKQPEEAMPSSIRQRFFSAKMISSYIMYFATCYGYYMVVTWLPSYLQERNIAADEVGAVSSIVAIFAIPGALVISKIADKFLGYRIGFIVALELIAAATFIFIIGTSTATFLMVALALYGLFGKLTVEPILISHVAQTASKTGYGTSFGVFNFFGMSSSVIAPALTGWLADQSGTQVTGFYVAIGLLIVGAIVFLIVNKTGKSNVVAA